MKHILITGVNRGIGKGLYSELSSRTDFKVTGTTRAGNGIPGLDLSSDQSIKTFLKSGKLPASFDTIVFNAAVYHAKNRSERETLFQVNVKAYAKLLQGINGAEGLVARIANGGSLICVSSGMGELSGLNAADRKLLTDSALNEGHVFDWLDEKAKSDNGNPYSLSKAALNALVRIWSRQYKGTFRVISVCPGWVRTDMGGSGAPRSVERAVGPIVDMIVEDKFSGGKFYRDGKEIPW